MKIMERSISADKIREPHELNQQRDQCSRRVTYLFPLSAANPELKFGTKQTELIYACKVCNKHN